MSTYNLEQLVMEKHRNFYLYLDEALTRCIRDAMIDLPDKWYQVPIEKIPPAEATKRVETIARIKRECLEKVNVGLTKMKLARVQDVAQYTRDSVKTEAEIELAMRHLLTEFGMDQKIGLYPAPPVIERIKRYLTFFFEAIVIQHR